MKVVIVGGVAGGMSAATRLRRLDERAEIVVLERGAHVSYANCGLPYHIGGVIPDRADLLLRTPEDLGARFALDVRTGHEVLSVDRAARTVRVRDLRDGREYTEPYDRLVLSPGATPVVPPVPGAERGLTLRDVQDSDRVLRRVEDGARSAVVVGGGFIGVEVAENLRHRGLTVALVEAADQVLAPLDPEMARPLAAELTTRGIELRLSTRVAKILPDAVELSTGETHPGDLVVFAAGVRPETALARAAGLELGPFGGIAVDGTQRTSDPDVFAVGDAAEKRDAFSGEPALVPLANLANRHGRLVADAIAGRPVRARPSVGTAVVKVFGLTAAATGWNEKRLRNADRPYRALHLHTASHAGYYPGARPLALKLLVEPGSERILGAQAVGTDGVDKRIDVLATAIAGGLAAPELADLELAYAPPFGSAKDPVNMLGYVAGNLADGVSPTVQWHEVESRLAAGALLLDVRTPAEHAAGTIPGARNIPLDDLRSRLGELPRGREILLFCEGGLRGHAALRILVQEGFRTVNLDGGRRTWEAARPVR
ncbi:FAD-dependent oxidoreductase [Streptomyces sp. F63]|uniref:FAD-dependent oxidoreductase n=1 Tax=Streptomyces sp. F63 TaxID=2824887 RepID=UPI001B3669C1|nr:FAD-dependent oxidoreductase [Streptomyces sp. F63]MBQ0986461.1 FAD-dependent oxidoreductase [Streptomyces sp. F63]